MLADQRHLPTTEIVIVFSVHGTHLHVDHRLILAIRFYNSFRDTDFIVLVTYKGANVIVS